MTRTQDYPCRICGAEFITEEMLQEHQRDAHASREEILRCHLCSAAFEERAAFDHHMDETHRGETIERFPCPDCGLEFPSPGVMEEHLARAHPRRPGFGEQRP